ncbi:MAG: FecR domain-containing protein, partial [Pirellulales bacterium]|nr:FecR domain-containing protein [Pirellulales bacterium]
MNADGNRTPSRDRVIELLSAEADQWLSGDGREELLSLLRSDPRARAAYVEHAILQSLLFHKARSVERRGARDEERGIEDLEIWRFGNLETTDLPLAASQFPLTPLPSSLSPSFIGGPVFSYMVATVVLALMLLGGWAYKVTYVRSVPSDVVRGSVTPAPVFVGRITGMKDCRWSDPNTRTLIGASVPLEREYSLSSGLMEITYGSGARVILEGPCTYRVESSAGGFLAIGKLTANIRTQSSKPKARSSNPSPLFPLASPLFSVRTPTATIADLGTEFGVEVDANGETTSHVFQGSV